MADENLIWNKTYIGFLTFLFVQTISVLFACVPSFFVNLLKKFLSGSEKNISGQTVLITGTAKGLGKCLAFEFADAKCKLICVDVDASLNEKTVQEINERTGNPETAIAIACDVGNLDSVKKLAAEIYKKYDKIDILVNNAGIIHGNPFTDENADVTRKVVDVNLLSSIWLVQTFLPKMKEQDEGHFVFINSMTSLTPLGDAIIYSSTKYGLHGFTDGLLDLFSRDPAYSKIKISSVHPVFIKTEGLKCLDMDPKYIIVETKDAAEQIITGIRREYVRFAVPGGETGYWILSLFRILPHHVYQNLMNRLYNKVLK